MKVLLGIACLLLIECTPRAPTVAIRDARTRAPAVAIRAVTVVDVMDGSLLGKQTVLVAGNRITAVGPADQVRIPRDAELVDAAGRYVIPGLWEMHVHSVNPVGVDTANRSIAAQDWHFPLFLAYGVTGVRNMNDGTADVTLELTNTIKRQLAEGSRRGPPRFLSAGPAVDGDPPLGMSKKVIVRTAPEARAVVEQLASNGADLVKVYENVSREAYFAIIDESRRRKIPVDGHVPFRITPEEAAAAGQRTVEHPEALAAGCSTKADDERERFAGVLADYDGPPGSEKLLLMQIPTLSRALRQPGSGRLRLGHRGIPAQPRGDHRRSARLSLHRAGGTDPFRHRPLATRSPVDPPHLGELARLGNDSGAPTDPSADPPSRTGECSSRE
jgi:hypothetical protein